MLFIAIQSNKNKKISLVHLKLFSVYTLNTQTLRAFCDSSGCKNIPYLMYQYVPTTCIKISAFAFLYFNKSLLNFGNIFWIDSTAPSNPRRSIGNPFWHGLGNIQHCLLTIPPVTGSRLLSTYCYI